MARLRAERVVCRDARAELADAFAALWAVPVAYAGRVSGRYPVLSPTTVEALIAAAERVAVLAARECPNADPCEACEARTLAYYQESVRHPSGPHHDVLSVVRYLGAAAYRADWQRWYDRLTAELPQ